MIRKKGFQRLIYKEEDILIKFYLRKNTMRNNE